MRIKDLVVGTFVGAVVVSVIHVAAAATASEPRQQPYGFSNAAYFPETDAGIALGSGTGAQQYHCNNRIVFKFNDGGTNRYFYLQLDSSSGAWTHTTTNPCS